MLLGSALVAMSIAWSDPRPAAAEQSPDRAAVEAFRRGDFEAAQNLWTAALERGEGAGRPLPPAERGRLLYDVGNAAFRRGNVLEAVGWYTASLRERPRDADTWKNLEHARATAKLDPADRGDLAATGWRLVSSLTSAESEWLALLGAFAWCALLVAEALRGGRLLRRLAFLGLLLNLATLAPWLYHRTHDGLDTVLVIEASEHGADVRSEPRPDAVAVGNAAAGSEVERLDELPGWTKIALPGDASGWIESRAAFPLRR